MPGSANGAISADFRHEALFYSSPEDFLDRTSAFLREGVEAGEPALVVLSAEKIEALRSRLNGHGDSVRFADMSEVGANPARIIPAWREFVADHAGRRLRGIGEPIWAERSPAELVECQRHESLLNLAFADAAGFYLLCPYDTGALGAPVLDEARRSHPFLASNGSHAGSHDYRGLAEVAAPFAEPLPEPACEPDTRIFQAGTLTAMRELVATRAAEAGFPAQAAEDLVLAVNEVATNSIRHAGGGGVLRIWQEGETIICEIQDRGSIDKPLAGRERPELGQLGGHGLWIANQVCDLVQIRSLRGGSVVRLHTRG